MKQIEAAKLQEALMILKEQPLNEIMRCGSMLCLGFGDKIQGKTFCKINGAVGLKEIEKSKYALHIECFFRIRRNDLILLTSEDKYKSVEEMQGVESDDDEFQWDMEGNNKLDVGLTDIFGAITLNAKDIRVNEYGDMTIIFSDGYAMDVFTDTGEEECWRFFESGNSEAAHIVVTGEGWYEE